MSSSGDSIRTTACALSLETMATVGPQRCIVVADKGTGTMTQYYFDGDPATESTRRHLERVLKHGQTHRWRWVVAMAAAGAALRFWHTRRSSARSPVALPPARRRES
jgi:hypothetical protein